MSKKDAPVLNIEWDKACSRGPWHYSAEKRAVIIHNVIVGQDNFDHIPAHSDITAQDILWHLILKVQRRNAGNYRALDKELKEGIKRFLPVSLRKDAFDALNL